MTKSKSELEKEIASVQNEEVMVATNDGTFGASECCRVTGSGDPRFGTYKIYERVGGGPHRVVGCDPENAPGRRREFRDTLNARRRHLSDLRAALRTA